MKFLIVDHYSWQDIEALRFVAEGHEIRVVPAALLSRIAQKHFPTSVFASLLGETYARPEYAEARRRYALAARKVLHDFYYAFPFDAVIVPSDTIIYLRAWAAGAHEMGLPFIVLQKETTISPYTMTEDARVIGQALPFIGDLMLVCSEHHKQFWLNTGAEPHKIIVTGQPRFDFYRQPERWKTLQSLGMRVPADRPTILFFSYDVGAYSPEGVFAPTWTQLRTETEETLIDLARQGHFNVLIKPHPQQQGLRSYKSRLRAMAGRLWGETVQLVPKELDARQLIVNTQVVVGFQTTALFEAMAAGKKVVYTFWTENTPRFVHALIPFHEMGDALGVARSPQELRELVLSDRGFDVADEQAQRRLQEAEKQLGPLDGQAAQRCLKAIEAFVREYAGQVSAEALAFRQSLDAQAPAYCRRALPKAQLAALFWRVAEWMLPLAYPVWLAIRRPLLGRPGSAGTYGEYRCRVVEHRRIALETIVDSRAVLARTGRRGLSSSTP